jgi:hypothetical protein
MPTYRVRANDDWRGLDRDGIVDLPPGNPVVVQPAPLQAGSTGQAVNDRLRARASRLRFGHAFHLKGNASASEVL